ncbi:glycerophosphodiester phosphodiesterase [Arenibacter sp. H213]|nr:glycerophosphodiester phosphodiesterase [Arenibacter sp. H213]MCM4168600.1 glycerophosphodiester phosphodiesterase [Arenibacter sp. H213]
MLIVFSGCKQLNKPLVIGHRGAMGHATENTLESIQTAMDLGVDMLEIDVFKTRDGEIVVFHDSSLKRLTGQPGNIEELDLKAVKALTLARNTKIPTLKEVLDLMKGETMLNIELKGAHTAESVNEIINHYINKGNWELKDFLISSYKWDELKRIRELNGKIPIAVLIQKDPLDAIPIGHELKAMVIIPNYKKLTKKNVRILHEEGFKIYPYTVNGYLQIKRMARMGVDGIITNYPNRVK